MKPEQLLKKAKKLTCEKKPEYWKLVNALEKTEFSNNFVKKTALHVSGNVFLEKNAVLRPGTVIDGNAFIGKNAVIGPNAFLRGNNVIESNCKISNSEIKNSVILKNSKIPHFSYIGDSVIGENVNFGAGSKIANLRLDKCSVKVDFFGEKIDSERRKLGAFVNSGTSIGLNACINAGIIIGRNCKILPLAFVKKSMPSNTTLNP